MAIVTILLILEKDTLTSENHGNFWALLTFRVDAGDTVIGEHLATAARNATYTSSVIQNQLVDILADQIRHKILDKVKRAIWYTIISDKVTDVSNKEQLSLVLRYVDPDTVLIRKDKVSLFECDKTITGRSLANKIIRCLQTYGLEYLTMGQETWQGQLGAQQLSLVHSTLLLYTYIVLRMLSTLLL